MAKPFFFYVPKSDSVEFLYKKALRALNYYMYNVRRDRSTIVTKCKLWITSDEKAKDLDAIDL